MATQDEHTAPRPPVPAPPARPGVLRRPAPVPPADPTVGSATSTGDDAVDAALTPLDRLDALPVREHVRVFDDVHTALEARLADVGD